MVLQEELQLLMYSMSVSKENIFFINDSKIIDEDFNHDFENIACDVMGVNFYELDTPNRKTDVVWCRYFIFSYLKNTTKYSLTKIGKKYKRDHSTVLAGIRKHKVLLEDRVYKMYHNQFLININTK